MSAEHRVLAEQLVDAGWLTDPRVTQAFRAVPRQAFLPGVAPEHVYADGAIVTKRDTQGMPLSSSSQPSIMATMLEQLAPQPGERVLEVGTGTGYNAALLAHLVGPQGQVVSADIDEELAAGAREHLAEAGVDRVRVLASDGWLGSPTQAPFDRIELTVGTWDLAPAWRDQLREGGTLVVPLWLRPGLQLALAFERRGDALTSRGAKPCGFQQLRGPHSGPATYTLLTPSVLAVLEDTAEDTLETLREVLEQEPVAETPPPLTAGWEMRLALDQPLAIQLATGMSPEDLMIGIYDTSEPSLAVIRGERLYRYGSPKAAQRLARFLRVYPPLAVNDLRVVVHFPNPEGATGQDGLPPPPEQGWRLPRPHSLLDVFEGG